jgi:hypothetical protein
VMAVPRNMRINAVLMSAVVFAVGGCSSTSKGGHSQTMPALRPSSATKMICESEARKDIAQSAVGFDTAEPLRPTWEPKRRIYSCDYKYAGGAKLVLSVKETSSVSEAIAYFDVLAKRLGRTRTLVGTGEGAYSTRDGDIVVRKDDKVLLVDVSKLPQRFGTLTNTRNDVATTVAVVIMGCWGSSGVIG